MNSQTLKWILPLVLGSWIAQGGETLPGRARLQLPDEIYATVGMETSLYFENIALLFNPADYAFDVICDKGMQQAERWVFTPGEGDAGSFPIRIEIVDESNEVIAAGESTVRVSPATAGGDPVSLLCIGDSLTHASVYTQHLLDLFAAAGAPSFSLVGTNGPGDAPGQNRHEGYGGWTAKNFVSRFTGTARGGKFTERGSPFLYPVEGETPVLDYGRYCQEVNGGKSPDFVTIFLGPNDIAWATDENVEALGEEMVQALDALIAAIRQAAPETQIGILPPTPPAASQDAFAANYGNKISRVQYRRNQHRVVERLIAHYDGRNAERLWIVPAYANLDCVHNYPTGTAAWNARTEQQGVRLVNGVHPSTEGYRQIGDSIFAWMQAVRQAP